MIRKAIIPAAGYGIRNLPITKVIPKELFPIGNRPAIDYVVAEAISAGITEILIVLSRNKNDIMNYFDRSIELETRISANGRNRLLPLIAPTAVHIQYVRQSDPLGLGHAVLLGRSFAAGEPFALLLPDQISLSGSPLTPLISCYEKYRSNVVGLQRVKPELLSNYGVAAANKLSGNVYEIDSIVEKPQADPPSNLALMGRYVLKPHIFDKLLYTRPGIGGEIQLTDALNEACLINRTIGYAYRERWYDTSIEEEYIEVQRRALQIKKASHADFHDR